MFPTEYFHPQEMFTGNKIFKKKNFKLISNKNNFILFTKQNLILKTKINKKIKKIIVII